MALPLLKKDSVIHVSDPKSIPYMFITMDVLRKFGITIGSEMEGDEEFLETQDWSLCTGITFKIKGGQKYHPASFGIEGDWSAAANFLVAGALYGKVRLEGLDTTSLQADLSIMDILMDAGASLSQLEDEFDENAHTGTITVQRAPLRAFDTDLNNCPDLFPIVSVLAAYCHGQSHIQGFKRLSSKESDRGTAILDMLEKMGVSAFAEDDALTVEGQSLESRCLTGNMLKGGEFTSSHDHRMAMALTVAAYGAATPIRIDDTQCVAKSFPAFYSTWESAL
jgi:3-phosphoshikimate 1-carboxyvinyltransferase